MEKDFFLWKIEKLILMIEKSSTKGLEINIS